MQIRERHNELIKHSNRLQTELADARKDLLEKEKVIHRDKLFKNR